MWLKYEIFQYKQETQFFSHVQKLSAETLSPPPISSHQLPRSKVWPTTLHSLPHPPPDGLGSSELLHQITVDVGVRGEQGGGHIQETFFFN